MQKLIPFITFAFLQNAHALTGKELFCVGGWHSPIAAIAVLTEGGVFTHVIHFPTTALEGSPTLQSDSEAFPNACLSKSEDDPYRTLLKCKFSYSGLHSASLKVSLDLSNASLSAGAFYKDQPIRCEWISEQPSHRDLINRKSGRYTQR